VTSHGKTTAVLLGGEASVIAAHYMPDAAGYGKDAYAIFPVIIDH
jgi:hypothetical protein